MRIEPIIRHSGAASDSALLLVLIAVMATAFLCAPTLSRIVGSFLRQLFRSRRETLPGEKTLGERLAVVIALIQTLVFEALIIYCARGAAGMPPLTSVGGLTLLTSGLFFVQLFGYRLVSYAFTSTEESHLWQSAFLLTQASLGFLLIIPAMGALFYPELLLPFLITAGVVYAACRIPLYISEFRIFYSSPASLFYFFLYLCTLEIVPLIALWALSGIFDTLFC